MLNTFGVKNLRSLKDTGAVKLAPITILLGENSSGKSTFLRTFPLLKQSTEAPTRSSILWFGKYVDFGDFDQALIREKGAKEIVFSFGLTVPDRIYSHTIRSSRMFKPNIESKVIVDLRLSALGKDGLTRTAGINLNIDGNLIKVDIGDSNRISSIVINGTDYSEYSDAFAYTSAVRILPFFQPKRESAKEGIFRPWWAGYIPDKVRENISSILRQYVHGKTGDDSLLKMIYSAPVGSAEIMYQGFTKLSNTGTWRSKTSGLSIDSPSYVRFKDLLLLSRLSIALYNLDEILDSTIKCVSYIEPIRASAQRYYRSQDISVKELDSKGENLAMFLRNLSDRDRASLDEWTLGEFGFKILVNFIGGHVNLGVAFKSGNSGYNLADMGFGYSQVIPIIVQLWTVLNKPYRAPVDSVYYTCVIEQPELHLHPRMQAKLAEILVAVINSAKKSGIVLRLIIETHSEVIVNKVGLMTADGVIGKEDSTIVLFSKESESSQTKVEFSNYSDDGVLQNWPFGFFDFEV